MASASPSHQETASTTPVGEAAAAGVPRVSESPRQNDSPRIHSFGVPAFKEPPEHLPNAVSNGLLAFDVDEKKREIFNQARQAIKTSAQYTKNGRKPWTQITVRLPIVDDRETSVDEDLAVAWALMRNGTRDDVKETQNASGDVTTTWYLWGDHAFLEWLNIDVETTKPVDKYVHPIKYCTGDVERKRLEKRRAKEGPSPALDEAFAKLEAKIKKDHDGLSPDDARRYNWAGYDQCIVTYKHNKQQSSKKKTGELVLTVKIRTYTLGTGDPAKHGGYMAYSNGDLSDIEPGSTGYALARRFRGY